MHQTNIPPAPQVPIYVIDDFRVAPGRGPAFTDGMGQLLSFGKGRWKLVAGCGTQPFDLTASVPGDPPPMMHIWRLDDRWSTLYDSMYATSELNWYTALEGTKRTESQDLLVGFRVGYGTRPRPAWPSAEGPGYVYRYEVYQPRADYKPLLLIETLVAFAEAVEALGWQLIWSASNVTGEARVFRFLWMADSADALEAVLREKSVHSLRESLNKQGAYLEGRTMYPIVTEYIDQTM